MECLRCLHWRDRAGISSIRFLKSVICFSNKEIFSSQSKNRLHLKHSDTHTHTHTHTVREANIPLQIKAMESLSPQNNFNDWRDLVWGWCWAPLCCGTAPLKSVSVCNYWLHLPLRDLKSQRWKTTSDQNIASNTFLRSCNTSIINLQNRL